MQIRIAGCRAVAGLILCLEVRDSRIEVFQPCLGLMLALSVDAFKCGDEVMLPSPLLPFLPPSLIRVLPPIPLLPSFVPPPSVPPSSFPASPPPSSSPLQECVRRILSVLVDVAESHALLFKGNLNEFTEVMIGVCSAESTPMLCKRTALEVLVSLAEGAPTHARRMQKSHFVDKLVSVCLGMMCEHSEDSGWETRQVIDEEDDDDDETNRGMGEEGLARLADVGVSRLFVCVCTRCGRGRVRGENMCVCACAGWRQSTSLRVTCWVCVCDWCGRV